MYNSTEFNYVIEGRVDDMPFRAIGHKLAGGGWQYRLEIHDVDKKKSKPNFRLVKSWQTTMAGVGKPDIDIMETLKDLINAQFGSETI